MRIKKGLLGGFAVATALFLTANAAGASEEFATWSISTTTHSAYANHSTAMTLGSNRPASITVDIPAGFDVKYTEPANGDTVATGTATARWALLLCATSTQNLTGTWQSTPDAGAPAGSVAQVNLRNAVGFTIKAFIVKQATADYEVSIPDAQPNQECSSGTTNSTSLTINGIVSGTTRHVIQNPSATGTYTATETYVDTNNVTHTDTNDSVTIT